MESFSKEEIGVHNTTTLSKTQKEINVVKGESQVYVKSNFMIINYNDKKCIFLISNIKNDSMVQGTTYNKDTKVYDLIQKPLLLQEYQMNMRGVDNNNQMCSYFESNSAKRNG